MFNLSGYTIKEKIHEGRKSSIYKGIRNKDHMPVIFKTLNAKHPEVLEIAKLKYEFEIATKADLPGVVKCYGVEHSGHIPVLILEDFGGLSLSKVIKKKKPDLKLFLRLTVKLADTLACLHEKNIIHKDINPNNIIINPESEEIKLTDFGIAAVLAAQNQGVECSGLLEGTLPYMSPSRPEE